MTLRIIDLTLGEERAPTPEEIAEWEEQQATFIPLPLTKLYKSTFIRRLSASEATTLDDILSTEEAYVRLLYNSVEWFDVSDAMIMYLYMTLETAFGAERADALLEPEM